MSSAEDKYSDEKVKAGPGVAKAAKMGTGAGLVLLLGAIAWGLALGDGGQRFFHSYLVSFTYFTSFALGGLFFVIVMHLIGAKWSVVMRRVAECVTMAFPLLFVLSFGIWVPMLFGNGGAIALGHPLGASGARLIVTLAHEMAISSHKHGLASMCIGVGQGIATILEKA